MHFGIIHGKELFGEFVIDQILDIIAKCLLIG